MALNYPSIRITWCTQKRRKRQQQQFGAKKKTFLRENQSAMLREPHNGESEKLRVLWVTRKINFKLRPVLDRERRKIRLATRCTTLFSRLRLRRNAVYLIFRLLLYPPFHGKINPNTRCLLVCARCSFPFGSLAPWRIFYFGCAVVVPTVYLRWCIVT